MIDVSIIIVSYNAAAELRRCLESLHAAPPAASHEIVVVDNGSRDGSVEVARCFAGVRLVESPVNRGFAAANNEGIRRSTGRTILLLNSDTVVPAGAVDGLLQELHRRPDATIVGPRLVNENGAAELSFGPMISPLNEWRQKKLMTRLARHEPAAVRHVDALARREHWPDWVSGACLLVRRAEAEAVGLLDERFFMYTEDVDFCASIRDRGGKVLFTPAVEIVHSRGRSGAADPEATAAAYRRSHIAFYEKHHPALSGLLRLYKRIRAVR